MTILAHELVLNHLTRATAATSVPARPLCLPDPASNFEPTKDFSRSMARRSSVYHMRRTTHYGDSIFCSALGRHSTGDVFTTIATR